MVSHLFFADNSYLFFKATESESRNLTQILLRYQNLSGQEINLNKSALTFSRNTDDVVKRGICSILQVEEQADPGIYLGMPAVVGKNKRQLFEFVRRKVWNRIQNWNGRRLSRAGKEICLKTVAQSIPTYVMQLLLLPKDLCRDIESMMNGFFWDSNPQRRSIRWMSWGKMSRYFRNSSFLNAELGSNPSYMWRSILAAQDLLKMGCYWSIASGTKVQVWGDSWLPNSSNRLIITPHVADFDGIKVDELITKGLWHEDFIRDKFMGRDADLILSIPLPMSSREDQISWSFDARGEYTARSGYGALRCFRQSAALVASDVDSNFVWAQLWKVTTPPKILNFAWRVARNCLPRNGRIRHSQQVVNSCFTMLESWFHANETLATAVTVLSYSSKWQKPDYGWIKINVDGAVFPDKGAIEALGVREVLSWIHERSRSRIVVETDCLRVVQAIQHKSCPNTSFGFIIADCLDMLQHLVDVQVVYARRSANSAAHCLAKGAGSFTSLHIWGYTPPQCIISCLHYDV
ncbi:hypothetical protein CK203_025818 [Vitis vinifera]|uniref:RNase H type-1 domain-containing protein n=1 Tax=Vitis vinifera TaxID=29760 RepID=A0A438IGQ7_VITVI|nr:hypothetical protein CK203_025818 [Vitis vinifera]